MFQPGDIAPKPRGLLLEQTNPSQTSSVCYHGRKNSKNKKKRDRDSSGHSGFCSTKRARGWISKGCLSGVCSSTREMLPGDGQGCLYIKIWENGFPRSPRVPGTYAAQSCRRAGSVNPELKAELCLFGAVLRGVLSGFELLSLFLF